MEFLIPWPPSDYTSGPVIKCYHPFTHIAPSQMLPSIYNCRSQSIVTVYHQSTPLVPKVIQSHLSHFSIHLHLWFPNIFMSTYYKPLEFHLQQSKHHDLSHLWKYCSLTKSCFGQNMLESTINFKASRMEISILEVLFD